jgi:hypothetical protein
MDTFSEDSSARQELKALRSEQSELANVLWLALAGMLLLTACMGVYLLRQNYLLHRQSLLQQAAAEESIQRNEQLMAIAGEFQKYGASHPDYASNVLSRFGLKPISGTAAQPGR